MKWLIPTPRQLISQYEQALDLSRDMSSDTNALDRQAQLRRLSALWTDAVNDIPYYRNLVRAGKAPEAISSWDAFAKIPILDRVTLKTHNSEFLRDSGPPDYLSSTGGSTGQPVTIGNWNRSSASLRIAKLVPWVRCGYGPKSDLVLIWGHAHLLGTGWSRYYNHAVRSLKDFAARYHRFDAYTLSEQKADAIARQIVHIKPAGVIGYASVLDLLARYTPNFHCAFREANIRFVMPCAEPPPRDDTFALLRATFDCPIVQEFGGVDFGHVAFKIDEQPYQLFHHLNVLECTPFDTSTQKGPAVVTTLYDRYVPLFRYQQGDILSRVVLDDVGFVTSFGEQEGRINDMVTMEDGVSVHSVSVVHCFKDEQNIFNVQLELDDAGPTFSLVVEKPLDTSDVTRIRQRLGTVHPTLATAPFRMVFDLESNRAGKRRWIVDRRTEQG